MVHARPERAYRFNPTSLTTIQVEGNLDGGGNRLVCLLLVRSHDDCALVLGVRAGLEATTLGSPVNMRHENAGSQSKVLALTQFPSLTIQDGVPIVLRLAARVRWEPKVG